MSSQTFTVFPSLPNELRQLIWLFSLPGPRTIIPFEAYSYDVFHTPIKAPKDHSPATLRTTHESRAVALRYYSNWLNAAAFGWQYIDFSIDTICFNASDFGENGGGGFRSLGLRTALLRLSQADLCRITRLELRFGRGESFGLELEAWILKWLPVLFPGLRKLDAVWDCWDGKMQDRTMWPDRDAHDRCVRSDVDWAREMAKRVLEEIEGKRRDGWKAPVLSVRWMGSGGLVG